MKQINRKPNKAKELSMKNLSLSRAAMSFHIGDKPSSNAKTGKMFVTTSDARTCPDSCPLKFARNDEGEIKFKIDGSPMVGACYAKTGPLSWHWGAVNKGKRGGDWDAMCLRISDLGPVLWRHNQAGDLPGENEHVDLKMLRQLIAANGDSKGFTYTHKKQAVRSQRGVLKALQVSNSKGFTINISADNDAEVDEFRALGLPVTVVIAEDSKGHITAGGNKIKVCPAQLSEHISCLDCGLCGISDRPHVVGFQAHGTKKALVKLG